MSITITTDVFCDKCNEWVFGATEGHARPKEARERARKAGWKRKRVEGRTFDLCPTCATIHGVEKAIKP